MPQPYRPWEVTLLVTRRVKFLVDARTPEQAESTAQEYLADGEAGQNVGALEIECEEVLPVEEITSDEVYKSDAAGFHS